LAASPRAWAARGQVTSLPPLFSIPPHGNAEGGALILAEFEFFELTGLPFDPPEKAGKKVRSAVDKISKELRNALGTATQQIERDTINAKLAFLESTSAGIFTSDDRLSPLYDKLARQRTDTEIGNLKAAIALLKLSGTRTVTNGAVRVQRNKTKLSRENVEKAYLEAGITITEIDPVSAYPKFPTNAEKIHAELEALRKMKDPNPKGKDLSLAVDLYAFAAYLCGEPENAPGYKSKPAPELSSLLDRHAKQLSTRNDDLGKLCASIATAGKLFIFNSEANREAYNAFLKYKSPALASLFETMRRLSKTDLADPKNAEQCIRAISKEFGSYEVALSIYNKEAGLKDDPYIPEKAVFHVVCPHCQNISGFADLNEAQKANKCQNCGKALYKNCGKCRKNVLVSLDKCPECGFLFASAAMFAKFVAAAEQALLRSDFTDARNNLIQARAAGPGEKARTAQLEARISDEERKYGKPVAELRKLIADRKFQKAAGVLAAAIAGFPGLNVSVFESQINAALAEADKVFTYAKNLPAPKQADSCLEILNGCADYKPAIDFLWANPPGYCKDFTVGLDSVACSANISWARSAERGVTYRVVRKQGSEIPVSETDGVILLDNTPDTSYKDKGIQPGLYYSYAVFAARYRVFSPAAGKTVALLADVTDIHSEILEKMIRITWKDPVNCTGVTIKRTVGGVASTLAEGARGSFEDKKVEYGVAHSYRLYANYSGMPPSNGAEVVITPTYRVESFTIGAGQTKNGSYTVTWDITRDGVDLRVLVDEKQVRAIKSDERSCDIIIPPGGIYSVAVLAYTGGAWLRSANSLRVNTYTPCEIDKQASNLYEDMVFGSYDPAYSVSMNLSVSGPVPDNVAGFYYAVRAKASPNDKAPWAGMQEIGSAPDIHRVDLNAYSKNGIFYKLTAHDESAYYITLFTIYISNGREIASNASLCRIDRPLNAELFWEIRRSPFSGMRLMINISANRPFSRIPELILACSDGQLLLSANDSNGVRLKAFPESKTGGARRSFAVEHELGADIAFKKVKGRKLFLFIAAPVPGENFTMRWAEGFTGKV